MNNGCRLYMAGNMRRYLMDRWIKRSAVSALSTRVRGCQIVRTEAGQRWWSGVCRHGRCAAFEVGGFVITATDQQQYSVAPRMSGTKRRSWTLNVVVVDRGQPLQEAPTFSAPCYATRRDHVYITCRYGGCHSQCCLVWRMFDPGFLLSIKLLSQCRTSSNK